MDDKVNQKVEQVKQNGLSVCSVTLKNKTYIYRGLNRKEFRDLQAHMAKMGDDLRTKHKDDQEKLNSELALLKEKGEEKVVLKCLLSPELAADLDIDLLPAGVVTKLADLVMKASGFDDTGSEEITQL